MQPDPAPRPAPPPPVVDEPPAGLGRRAAAAALDAMVLLALGGWPVLVWWSGAVRAVTSGDPVPAPGLAELLAVTVVVVVALAQWMLHGQSGATLGRHVVGIRTLDVETREPLGLPRVLLRSLVVAAGGLACAVGALVVLASPAFDRTGRRRGWHDLAARDEVLLVRRRPAHRRDPGDAAPHRPEHAADVPQVAAAPEPAPVTSPVRVPRWAADGSGTAQLSAWFERGAEPALVLAPLAPARSGPDLDTRAIPVVVGAATAVPAPKAPPTPATGLDPALELTRPAPPRRDVRAEPTTPLAAPATALVELSDGRRLTIERTALVGRNPAAVSAVQLVRVVDPARSVSKTHLQIGVEHGGVWVADRGSTNGTVVTLPDGAQVVCQVDHQVRLRVGATVSFGDCWLRLVRAPGTASTS